MGRSRFCGRRCAWRCSGSGACCKAGRRGDSIRLHLTGAGKKVALDRSEYLLRLQQALDAAKGGDARDSGRTIPTPRGHGAGL